MDFLYRLSVFDRCMGRLHWYFSEHKKLHTDRQLLFTCRFFYFNSCQFGTGLQIPIMCQFGTGLQIAIMLIHQQISVLFISGIQAPQPCSHSQIRHKCHASLNMQIQGLGLGLGEKKRKDLPNCENNYLRREHIMTSLLK